MLMWTPKMWHMRTQRRHVKSTLSNRKLKQIDTEKKPNTEPIMVFDNIQHKRHFPNCVTSHGLKAYFGYD